MPLFECGSSNLLPNKDVYAKPSVDVVYKAISDNCDGFEQVTVKYYARLGKKDISTNGVYSVTSGDNSYASVDVKVIPAYSELVRLWSGDVRGDHDNTITVQGMNQYNYVVCFGSIVFPTEGVNLSPAMGSSGYSNNAGSTWGSAPFNIILPVQPTNDPNNLKLYRPVCAIAYFEGWGTNPNTGASDWVYGYRTGGNTICPGNSVVYFGNQRTTLFPNYSAIDTTWGHLYKIYGMKA